MNAKEFNDISGMKGLAAAVIRQAFEDAKKKPSKRKSPSASQCLSAAEIDQARAFLLGSTQTWRESLEFYADLAQTNATYIIKLAKKEKWYGDWKGGVENAS